MNQDEVSCPRCGRVALPRWEAPHRAGRMYYYVCRHNDCRCAFSALAADGFPTHVMFHSPIDKRVRATVAYAGCPTCRVLGANKWTDRHKEPGKIWRRKECSRHGPYYTCEDLDGITTIHKRLPGKYEFEQRTQQALTTHSYKGK